MKSSVEILLPIIYDIYAEISIGNSFFLLLHGTDLRAELFCVNFLVQVLNFLVSGNKSTE